MYKNYIKMAFRNFIKHKTYSFINILSLSTGMVCSIIILLWVWGEFNYDNYHTDGERIFRIVTEIDNGTEEVFFATTHPPVADVLINDFPQIDKAVRFVSGPPKVIRINDQKMFYEKDKYFRVDADLFEVFSIPFVYGNSIGALKSSESVVISESIANKYFGSENPLGRTINFDKMNWQITGVFEDIPNNSHLPKFQIISLFQFPEWANGWNGLRIPTYIKINPESNINELKGQLENLAQIYASDILKANGETRRYLLQPLKDIHLYSNYLQEYAFTSNSTVIIIFTVLGFIILFVACLNYINLSMALSIKRWKEIGVRKILGADKFQIFKQFLGDSILTCLISLLISLPLIEIMIPVLNNLMGISISNIYLSEFSFIIVLLFIIIFVVLLSGVYPSFLLSSTNAINILKNNNIKVGNKKFVRNFLIIFQYTIASFLIIGSIIIYNQIYFMKNKDLGFKKEQMLVLPMQDQDMMAKVSNSIQTLREEITKHHSVISLTAILRTPGRIEHHDNIELISKNDKKSVGMHNIFVDHDFINTYDIKMAAGRTFNKDLSTDVASAFIINESALKSFGWRTAEEAIGKRLSHWMGNGDIIGVCKNFHLWSLHRPIEPLFFLIPPRIFPEVLTLKLETVDYSETLQFLRNIWKVHFSEYPFEYYFLDKDFNRQYRADEIFNNTIFILTGLAIFIACIGLFSLASITIEHRTKEIGIRKVLGSTVTEIAILLNREFFKLIVIASLISWPLAYFIINQWLQNFAFRIDINFYSFLLSCMLIVIVSFLTICIKSIKASITNPINALRFE